MWGKLLPMIQGAKPGVGASAVAPDPAAGISGALHNYATIWGFVKMPKHIHIASDNTVVVADLRYAYTGLPITDATLTCGLTELDGTPIVSDVGMAYQAGTDSDYMGVIDAADVASLVDKTMYLLYVDITVGSYNDYRLVKRKARYHGVE